MVIGLDSVVIVECAAAWAVFAFESSALLGIFRLDLFEILRIFIFL